MNPENVLWLENTLVILEGGKLEFPERNVISGVQNQ